MVGSWTRCLSRKAPRQHEHSSLIVTGNDKTQKDSASVKKCDVWIVGSLKARHSVVLHTPTKCITMAVHITPLVMVRSDQGGHAYNVAPFPG